MVLASFKTPIDGYCTRVAECYSSGPADVFQCQYQGCQAGGTLLYVFRYLQERARSGEDSPVGKPVNQRTDLAGEPVTLKSCPPSTSRVLGITYSEAASVL